MQTTTFTRGQARAALAARRDELIETRLPEARALLQDEATAVKTNWYDRAGVDLALQDVQALEQELRDLAQQLAETSAQEAQTTPPVQAAVGSRVTLRDLAAETIDTYDIVATAPYPVRQHVITAHSLLGRQLLGHGPGDIIEAVVPDGLVRYQIGAIA